MSVGVRLKYEPEAIDSFGVEDFVHDHLTRTARLDRPLSDSAYEALRHHSRGNRRLLLTLSSLAVFLAGLESANQVESRHVDAAALSRSEVESTDGAASTVTADASAKIVISKFGQGVRGRRHWYAGVVATMLACFVLGASHALSPTRPTAPAGLAPGPPAVAPADPAPKVSPTNAIEAAVATPPSPPATPADEGTTPSRDSGAAFGVVAPMANNARNAPPPSSHVLVTFVASDGTARERAVRLTRYLRDNNYDAEVGPLLEGSRHAGHVEYFFGTDASAAAQVAALLGGGFGAAMLTPIRPDQRRPGTIEIAMPSGKAVLNSKGASSTIDPFELWHEGKNR